MIFSALKWLIVLLWLCSLGFLWDLSSTKSDVFVKQHKVAASPPPLSQLQPKILKIITLGHKNLYDDFAHIWLIQILADDARLTFPLDVVTKTIYSIIAQEPKIESLYLLSCFSLAEDFKKPELCQKITMAGLKIFPNSFRLAMMQGWVHAFKTNEPAQAAAFYAIAASRENAPPYVKGVVKKMLNKEKLDAEDYEKSLEIVLNTSTKSKLKEMFLNKKRSSFDNNTQSENTNE